MNTFDRDRLPEERLARLMSASRAAANPAVLARARARLEARPNAPRLALWLARPAVLAGAGVLFALCVAGTFVTARQQAASTTETNLIASLIGEEDLGLPTGSSTTSGAAENDSGGVTP
jgi:hypothetical protein